MFLEASESARLRMEESLPNSHEDLVAGKEDNSLQHYNLVARGMGSPRRAKNRRRRTGRGPELACVQTPLMLGVAHAGGEGWINILPGVAKTSSETQRRKSLAAQKRVSGRHVVRGRQSSPILEVRPGKAGENGQYSGEMGGSSPWTRPSAPECGDTLRAPAGDQRPI